MVNNIIQNSVFGMQGEGVDIGWWCMVCGVWCVVVGMGEDTQ